MISAPSPITAARTSMRSRLAIGMAIAFCASTCGAYAPDEDTYAFHEAIQALTAIDVLTVGSVDQALFTRLSKELDNGSFTSYTAHKGEFANLPISEVELRCRNGAPGDCLLSIELARPGPMPEVFVETFWPTSEFTLASPHGSGSRSYWSVQQGRDRISVGLLYTEERITALVIDRIPPRANPSPTPLTPLPPLPPEEVLPTR
ncbi:hypothetical protein [Lysobacter sp. 1R34A]|uniref:hypothetical protein n=1 Tax=Lysobacter sp. 1R34A TaxID=3445786 RepID=UPI003EEA68A3